MNNEIRVFNNVEFGEVRTFIDENGKVLFCGKDIALSLGYKRPADAISSHCKGVRDLPTPTSGGTQKMKYISESDVYRLITHSKLPSAEKFENWVFEEVLPSIRKTGGYVANEDMFINTYLPFADETTKMLFKNTLAVVQNQNKLIEKQKKEITHKSNVIQGFADNISLADKRQIINQVMRYNTTNHAGKWNMLYTEFDKAYHMDTKTRLENHIAKGNAPKYKNRIDYIDKHLNMLNELYAVAVKLFESDVEQIKARYDVYSNIA